jgi:hypothetical protein
LTSFLSKNMAKNSRTALEIANDSVAGAKSICVQVISA